MAHGRRPKAKPKEKRHAERLRQNEILRLRDELGGNLYGVKLKEWFYFNGQSAVIIGTDKTAKNANRDRLLERIAMRRDAKGVSAQHRERGKNESGV